MTQRRLPRLSTFILGFGFFGISNIWSLFNSLIPPVLKSLGLTAGVTGFVLTWDNLINLFSSRGSAAARIARTPVLAGASPG